MENQKILELLEGLIATFKGNLNLAMSGKYRGLYNNFAILLSLPIERLNYSILSDIIPILFGVYISEGVSFEGVYLSKKIKITSSRICAFDVRLFSFRIYISDHSGEKFIEIEERVDQDRTDIRRSSDIGAAFDYEGKSFAEMFFC